ncbi:MAG TPA: iron-containing alcohol dehydrogenase [Candidatus Copromorpha excrementigallinarum]|uniref:Iron-containing alcohol dehydrogenase n=1 Tax=Candidatus Allocopromorpha excrementigallinarum TaxID=2840742 RepID=A0A9D1HYL3_9FIRM|nr:iron-containing alcohol dehydrogenase [Candidatus Copromorpha excrementigallinarum]
MDKFTFTYPAKVYFGRGTVKDALRQELSRAGGTVMLAYGGGSLKRSGLYREIMEVLVEEGKETVEFSGIMPNPTYAKLQEGAKLARERHVDFILAAGGGSVIDCCKVISVQAMTHEDVWSMEYQKGKFPAEGIPMGAVVTASGTGAEMNSGAVITCEDKNWKGPVLGKAPVFAILDPDCTATVPAMQVLSGAFDTLSHAMETYLGSSDEDNVSDDVALAVMRNTVVNTRRLIEDINDMQARGNLMWDSAMAENGILKAGRMTDFQAHQIEHQLGAYTDCNHGQGLAVIQPVYYRHILRDAEEKFTRLAREVFGKDTAEEGLEALSGFVKECGLPTRLGQLKSKTEITREVLRKVADTCNIIKSNPRELSRDEIYEILCQCM